MKFLGRNILWLILADVHPSDLIRLKHAKDAAFPGKMRVSGAVAQMLACI